MRILNDLVRVPFRAASFAALSLALLSPPNVPTAEARQPVPERGGDKDKDKLDKAVYASAKAVLADTVSEIRDRIKNGKAIKEEAVIPAWIEAAAKSASKQDAPDAVKQKAFLIALGMAFEKSEIVNQLLGKEVREIESADERKARLELLADATYGKKARMVPGAPFDKTQHFFMSALLTAVHGPEKAEAMGVQKEQLDLALDKGFDMGDIGANLRGIAFAEKVMDGTYTLKAMSVAFDSKKKTGVVVADLFPAFTEMNGKSALDRTGFDTKYGTTTSDTFKRDLAAMKEALQKK